MPIGRKRKMAECCKHALVSIVRWSAPVSLTTPSGLSSLSPSHTISHTSAKRTTS